MRALPFLLMVTGCGFSITSGGAPIDSSGSGSATEDSMLEPPTGDSAVDATIVVQDAPQVNVPPLDCLVAKPWIADFSIDPRIVNVNFDLDFDWVVRDAPPLAPFPGTLQSGVWTAPGLPPAVALDTNPAQNFTTLTRVTLRMEHHMPVNGTTDRGAVFWINMDYDGGDFAPIWLALTRSGSNQRLELFTKDATAQTQMLGILTGLPTGMIDIVMDIDPVAHTISVVTASSTAQANYTEIPINGNTDRYATAMAWTTAARFDYVRVDVCL